MVKNGQRWAGVERPFVATILDDGRYRLSPAYDLLSTRLVIPDDRLALPLGGRDDRITHTGLVELAGYCKRRSCTVRVGLDLATRPDFPQRLRCIAQFPSAPA